MFLIINLEGFRLTDYLDDATDARSASNSRLIMIHDLRRNGKMLISTFKK